MQYTGAAEGVGEGVQQDTYLLLLLFLLKKRDSHLNITSIFKWL
jgi:hypothetical protein